MLLSARTLASVVRAVKRVAFAAQFRVALCGTHTFEPLDAYLRAHGAFIVMGIDTYVAPYGQYMQQLLVDDSDLLRFDPHLIAVSCSLRQIAPRLYSDFGAATDAELRAERERIVDHLSKVADSAASRSTALVLVSNFPRPASPALGIADAKQPIGEMEFYLELNLELIKRFRGTDRVHILDLDRLIGGVRPVSSERMYFLAKSIWDETECNAIADELLRFVVAGTGRTRKCLVVDLDNTLWKGVVGEDGPMGVEVGPGSAVGEAFLSHQFAIRALKHRGIMLAICSKNNPSDVDELFLQRTDMPLKKDDFLAASIGWGDKASGLQQIAEQLNICADSFVFLDDNPAERAIVRGELPAVAVPELPIDPAYFATFLRRQVYFEKLRINSDDLFRLQDYGAQSGREQLRAEARDLDSYLASLETRVLVRPANRSDLARVHELFNKTNQFNLTTRRYSLAEVQSFLDSTDTHLGVVIARDQFGPMGTVGVYLLRNHGNEVVLDSLLLSCRALGRGIGTATMNCAKQEVQAHFGCGRMIAQFIPTAKNQPAAGFLARQGLELLQQDPTGAETYVGAGRGLSPVACAHVTVEHEGMIDREPEPA